MITVYTLENAKKWDEIIKSFNNYDVYYLSGYVKAFQLHGDGQPLLIYYASAQTRAVNVVMKRDLANCKFLEGHISAHTLYDITTPYGYGGFIIEGNDCESLQKEYIDFCKKECIVCEFVRFHPLLENWKYLKSLYTEVRLGETICINTENAEQIWCNMTSKNRNMIRKAEKNGISVYWGRDDELIPYFMEMYNTTMDRDSATAYYYFQNNFYESILKDLKQNAMWFYAKKDGEIIAMSIFMFCNEKMHYHLSCSKKEYQKYAPTNLLLYEAALWAASHGYKKIHLGGGVSFKKDSLYTFKKAFNRGEDLAYYVGKQIFDKDKYDYLVQQRILADSEFDKETSFFPSYRA